MKRLIFLLAMAMAGRVMACANLLVTRGASTAATPCIGYIVLVPRVLVIRKRAFSSTEPAL